MPLSRRFILPLRSIDQISFIEILARQALRPQSLAHYTIPATARRGRTAWQLRPHPLCGRRTSHHYQTSPKSSKFNGGGDILPQSIATLVLMASFVHWLIEETYLHFNPWYLGYQVVDVKVYSATTRIITISRDPTGAMFGLISSDTEEELANRRRNSWREGIWTALVSDSTRWFPRVLGHTSLYTPLPPLENQSPNDIRFLVHEEENEDPTGNTVNEKLSTESTLLRISRPRRKNHIAPIPDDIEQVILLASSVAGIAPVLQTIHTLLEVRKGKNVRVPHIHVVWFKEDPGPDDRDGSSSSPILSSELSEIDRIASQELERLYFLHTKELSVESVNVGATPIYATNLIQSSPGRRSTRLQSLLKANDSKLLLISGPKSFPEYLTRHKRGQNVAEDGQNIPGKAKEAGWRVVDLSATRVSNRYILA